MSRNYNMPPTCDESNDLIFMLEHYYETNGLSVLKVAANELRRLYALFDEKPVEMDQFTPDITIRMGVVMKIGCRYFNVNQSLILSHIKTLNAMIPRQIIMYLGKELTNLSYPQLGAWFNRDHTTIINAYEKVKDQIQTQPKIKKYVEEITILCQKEAMEEHKRIQELKKCPEPIQLVMRKEPKKPLIKQTPQPVRPSMNV